MSNLAQISGTGGDTMLWNAQFPMGGGLSIPETTLFPRRKVHGTDPAVPHPNIFNIQTGNIKPWQMR